MGANASTNASMSNQVVSGLSVVGMVSRGDCIARALNSIRPIILFGGATIVLLLIPTDERKKVQVAILSAESSHELRDVEVTNVTSDEEIVTATRKSNTSKETCTTTSTRNSRGHNTTKTTCRCSGYEYEYDGKQTTCPGHNGRCRVASTHDVFLNTTTKDIRCKKNSEKLTCNYEIGDKVLSCTEGGRKCSEAGIKQFPVDVTTDEAKCPGGAWNNCKLVLDYNNKTYDFSKTHDAACEDLKSLNLWYSKKKDNFKESHVNFKLFLRIASMITGFITASIALHSISIVVFPFLCHAENVKRALNWGTGRRTFNSGVSGHTHSHSHSETTSTI
tara:strand:- start:2266 stop:3264 length:999 start_codon:yes stop_codon:yes gene_type:complete